MEYSKYHVLDSTGKPFTVISESMCMRQGIDDATLDKIKNLHGVRHMYVVSMQKCAPKMYEDRYKLRSLAEIVTEYDYQLQELWGFGRNKNFHKFWELPHCTCPRHDNMDRIGTPYAIINRNCILHGETND